MFLSYRKKNNDQIRVRFSFCIYLKWLIFSNSGFAFLPQENSVKILRIKNSASKKNDYVVYITGHPELTSNMFSSITQQSLDLQICLFFVQNAYAKKSI